LDVSLKKKLLQQCDDGEDSDASRSSDSEVHAKTAKKCQKNAKSISEDSDSSHLLAVSKNKQKRERLDREIIKNVNINTQSNS